MSCNSPYFQMFYRHKITRNKSESYNRLTRRYKRRNRHIRYTSKKHRDFCRLMDDFYHKLDLPLFYSDIGEDTVNSAKQLLQPFLAWLKREYELILLPCDPDYRSGFETYGYTSNSEDMTDALFIFEQLDYISERWRCSFRVRWLINLLEPEYVPYHTFL